MNNIRFSILPKFFLVIIILVISLSYILRKKKKNPIIEKAANGEVGQDLAEKAAIIGDHNIRQLGILDSI